jgi:hypothetical protein
MGLWLVLWLRVWGSLLCLSRHDLTQSTGYEYCVGGGDMGLDVIVGMLMGHDIVFVC